MNRSCRGVITGPGRLDQLRGVFGCRAGGTPSLLERLTVTLALTEHEVQPAPM